jgi:hypothetical protein
MATNTSSTSRPVALDRLEVFVGRWITEGSTAPSPEAPAAQIVASDVYAWAPGGRFLMHPAYGRIGSDDVGGLEVIGHDPETGQYKTHFFDSEGNVLSETLSHQDGTWIWQGSNVRCTGTFAEDRKVLVARHERSDDGVHWVPSMTVTLRKIE